MHVQAYAATARYIALDEAFDNAIIIAFHLECAYLGTTISKYGICF